MTCSDREKVIVLAVEYRCCLTWDCRNRVRRTDDYIDPPSKVLSLQIYSPVASARLFEIHDRMLPKRSALDHEFTDLQFESIAHRSSGMTNRGAVVVVSYTSVGKDQPIT
jgi:hypothetical protein